MIENFIDYARILDDGNDAHPGMTLRVKKRIDLIDELDESGRL